MATLKKNYTETKLITQYGKFNIRVYAEALGKETVVLWSEKTDRSKPVLIRIHSECMTGDTFRSLKCDCGEQLVQSLKMINKGGGALIYLRQEGRGIGLFEKIRTYKLQDEGYDTFEANLLLGHNPDERSYEMAKTALDDLKIKQIKLLTNNPSKVSEIAKLGIKVVERVPIIIKSNKYNKDYFESKKNKFKHFFHSEVSYYFYQFHAETREHVEEVGEFLKNKKRDPLLKICVGVAANHQTLSNKEEINRIESIFKVCEFFEGFVPILHFSFSKSTDVLKDLRAIKKNLPFVKYLQTNDLPKQSELEAIKLACRLFLADIPLSDDNFKLVHDKTFRNYIKKYKAFILLDNSKGKGIRESKESLMKKIDALLGYGLNDIAIFGGFGPDDLDTYFELRRYYKINFSVDAETKLKSSGRVDIEKVKLYMLQLIRFDDPKQAGIEQTRTFMQQMRRKDWKKVSIGNREFSIHPAVFDPGSFPSTSWFAEIMQKQVKGQLDFCEVGCGSGTISCLIALKNPKMKVVATDINPFATENTKFNAKKLGIGNRLKVVTGDVLDGVNLRHKFNSIFWALPFGFLDPGANISYEEMQVFDPGYRATRKFLKTAKKYLKPTGKIFIGFSSDLGHPELLKEMAKESHIKFNKIADKEMKESDNIVFEVLSGKYL